MRKLYFLLAVVLAIALIGCGGGNKSSNTNTTNNNSNGNSINNPSSKSGPVTFDSGSFRSSSTVEIDPDHLRVFTGATNDELNARINPIGAEVTSRNGNYVTIKVNPSSITETANIVGRIPGVFSVEPIQTYISGNAIPLKEYPYIKVDGVKEFSRSVSFYVQDAHWGDRVRQPDFTDASTFSDPTKDVYELGQKWLLDPASPSGGWDVVTTADVLNQKVTLAIIDGGINVTDDGVNTTLHPDLAINLDDNTGDTTLNPASGFISETGTASAIGAAPWAATKKLENISWPLIDNGTGGKTILRHQGNMMFGLIAAALNQNVNYTGQPDPKYPKRSFLGSIAGINPWVDLMILKTGVAGKDKSNNDIWTFPDASVAASIKYAVDNGANVILLGMWAEGSVPAVIATEIASAKAKDVLVIAPAGGSTVTSTTNNPNFKDPDGSLAAATPSWTGDEYFDNQTTIDKITPAGNSNVLSVGSIGINHYTDTLSPVQNPYNTLGVPWIESIIDIAGFSTKGAVLGAPGIAYSFDTSNQYNIWVGSEYSAAIAAGAATIVYKGIKSATGSLPAGSWQTAWDILSKGCDYNMQPDFQFGRLNIGRSAAVAANGGFSKPSDPSLDFTDFQATPELNKVGTNQDFSIKFSLTGGDPTSYQYGVIWGDGTVVDWTKTTEFMNIVVKKAAPYTKPGVYGGAVYVKDGKGKQDSYSFSVQVTNPLGVSIITTEKAAGTALDPDNLFANKTYILTADTTNIMNFPGNTLSYVWTIDGTTQASKTQSITYTAPAPKTSKISVTVTESMRSSVTKEVDAKFQ